MIEQESIKDKNFQSKKREVKDSFKTKDDFRSASIVRVKPDVLPRTDKKSLFSKKDISLIFDLLLNETSRVDIKENNIFTKIINDYGLFNYFFYSECKNALNKLLVETKAEYKSQFFINLQKKIKQKNFILRFLKELSEKNIDAIVLKGPFLGERIYHNDGVRVCGCDVDIMIKPSQHDETKQILKKFGYTTNVSTDKIWGRDKFYGQTHWIPENKNYPSIDLHFKPLCGIFIPDLDIGRYWDNILVKEIDGCRAALFNDEILFIYLCFLIYKEDDTAKRIRYLLDFAFFLKKNHNNIDYDKIISIAKDEKVDGLLSFSLDLLAEYYPASRDYSPGLVSSMKLSWVKKRILSSAIRKFWVFERSNVRWKRYGIRTLVFSGGYFSGILTQLKKIYKLSYLDFCEENNIEKCFLSTVKHWVYFNSRIFSRTPRR